MKKNVTGPVLLTLFGLASLYFLSPMTHSPEIFVKFSALIVPLLLTLSGMAWLLVRLQA